MKNYHNKIMARNFYKNEQNPNQTFMSSSQILRQCVKEYYQKENWRGLLGYLLLLNDRHKLPLSYKWQIGQAYLYQHRFREALDFLRDAHFENPDQPDIQFMVICTLHALKRSEHNFPWLQKPEFQYVDRSFLGECFEILKKYKNSIPLFILYTLISEKSAIEFDEFDLLVSLKKENRFHIINDTCFYRFSRVSIQSDWLEKTA